MIPSIHLNGTSKEELLKQVSEAGISLATAIGKLREAAPHGRDYYPQDENWRDNISFRKAHAEWDSRMTRLQEVQQELLDLHEAIYNGGFKR